MPARRFSFGRAILAFVGLVILVMGMALSVNNLVFNSGAQRTTGTVMSVAWEGPEGTEQRPTIAYIDFDGLPHYVPLNTASADFDFSVGDEVPILYNFRTNAEVRLDTWVNGWMPGVIAGLLGLFMLRQALRSRKPVMGGTAVAPGPWADATGQKAAAISAIEHRQEKPAPTKANTTAPMRQPAIPAPKPIEPTVRRMR